MDHITLTIAAALLVALVLLLPLAASGEGQSIRIHPPNKASDLTKRIAGILANRIEERCGAHVSTTGDGELDIYLAIRSGIGSEGFKISDHRKGGIDIIGNDERGLLYGVGRLLHMSTYSSERGLTPGQWRGVSVPAKPVRGMYLATHFRNYYAEAPIDEVKRYIEDLSLWGVNSYLVWFGMDAYSGIDDPNAQAMLARLHILLKTVKDLGMNASLGCVANDSYANSPVELRADSTVGHDGYHPNIWNSGLFNLGPELCPSKEGVPELEVRYCQQKFDAFKDIGLDYWFLWPYDNGGCTCTKCAPWGVNGYLMEARAYRRAFPKGKVVLSTWYFDHWIDGEWKGITDKFNAQRPDWLDYILADDYGGKFPEYPLAHGSPGGLPMISFPEISMYLHAPWGGYGANPLPQYLQTIWDVTKAKLSGGFPYSEGIYEDVNKVMCAQLWWNPDKPTTQTMREYISFYFSPAVVDDVSRAMEIMEKNLERHREDRDGVTTFVLANTDGAVEAFRLVAAADSKLPAAVRASWRWRVVYLRALIDSELVAHKFRVTDKCMAAFRELTTIYHEENGSPVLAPPKDVSGVLASED
jgi:hypothetical protein